MPFLRKSVNGDETNENETNEELYEKLFPKIGRDFVYKEDLYKVLRRILFLIDPSTLKWPDIKDDSEARKLALEYKNLLEKGKSGSDKYKDLIKLDDDDDDKPKNKKNKDIEV